MLSATLWAWFESLLSSLDTADDRNDPAAIVVSNARVNRSEYFRNDRTIVLGALGHENSGRVGDGERFIVRQRNKTLRPLAP